MLKKFGYLWSLSFCLIFSMQVKAQYRADSAAVIKLLMEDYKTVANFDTVQHRKNCTYDYLLVEEGEVWSLEKEMSFIRTKASGKTVRTNDFSVKAVRTSGATAYAVYELKSSITESGESRKYRWLETAIFRKVNNVWRIAHIHSTRLDP